MTLRPAPYPDPEPNVETVEVSIEFEPPRQKSADISAAPPKSPPPSDGPADGNARRLFELPARPTFNPHAPSLGLDPLGALRDCLSVEGSGHETSKHPPRAPSPCAYADLSGRAPATGYQPNESGSNGGAFRTGDDYRTFKTIQPMFDESLFPEKAPQANRALKKWFLGLFR